MDVARKVTEVIEGTIRQRRVGRWRFPVEQLVVDDEVIANLGRDGSLRFLLGRGRRVRLADGTEWRIKSTTSGRHIVPIVSSASGVVAVSGPLYARRSYGINGKDYAYFLIPLGRPGLRNPRQWTVRRYEEDIATVDDRERVVRTDEPIATAAVLLIFTLMKHGIAGEGNLMPKRD